MGNRYGEDPEMQPRIAERFTFNTLVRTIERLCAVPPDGAEATQRRKYVRMAKETWAEHLRALDR